MAEATYRVDSVPIASFIGETGLQLPVFQRKSTWKERQRFNLAIAVYRQYPPGFVVVKETRGGTVLLDGRQRWETFLSLRDPHQLWTWARKALSLRTSDTSLVVEKRFRRYFDNFIGVEDWQMPPDDPNRTDDLDLPHPASSRQLKSLDKLLELILLVHPVRSANGVLSSRMTDTFAFHPAVQALPYYTTVPGVPGFAVNTSGDTDGLFAWLRTFEQHCAKQSGSYPPRGSATLLGWIAQTTQVANPSKLAQDVRSRWPYIRQVLSAAADLEARLGRRDIGKIVIETDDADDEKKIFELINSAGTPLTAVEILSARPDWSAKVTNPATAVSVAATNLIEQMGTGKPGARRDVRKWDVAASILDRVDLSLVFGDPARGARAFERHITLGFQLYAGLLTQAISKKDLEGLHREMARRRVSFQWGSVQLDQDLSSFMRALAQVRLFRGLVSWRQSVVGLTSDAVGLDFFLRSLFLWRRLGRPANAGGQRTRFRRETSILLDRLIFEYVTGEWRGSSDSRIASHLTRAAAGRDRYQPIRDTDWETLVTSIVRQGTLGGEDYRGALNEQGDWVQRVDPRITTLLYYREAVRQDRNPSGDADFPIEVDHVIPRKAFRSLPSAKKTLLPLQAGISNLALLPARLNNEKSGSRLDQVNQAARPEVGKYEDVPLDLFRKFSNPNKVGELSSYREPEIIWDLTKQRQKIVDSEQARFTPYRRKP
jgi:hypothetical protein